MQLNYTKRQIKYNFQEKELKKRERHLYYMDDLSLFKDVKIIIFLKIGIWLGHLFDHIFFFLSSLHPELINLLSLKLNAK